MVFNHPDIRFHELVDAVDFTIDLMGGHNLYDMSPEELMLLYSPQMDYSRIQLGRECPPGHVRYFWNKPILGREWRKFRNKIVRIIKRTMRRTQDFLHRLR